MADNYDFEIGFFEGVYRRDPKNTDVIEILGNFYTRGGRFREGLKMDRKNVRLQPDNAVAHYNLACSLALLDRKADAVKSLRDAVQKGYNDFAWVMKDQDLNGLHNYKKFKKLLEEHEIKT